LGRVQKISADARSLYISIGNVSMSLRFFEERLLRSAQARYRDFSGSPCDGIRVTLNDPAGFSAASPRFEYRLRGSHLRFSKRRAEFRNVPHEYALDSLIRILLTVALLPKDGFLLHAASIVRNGKAYVFVGRSGAGKSTVASLSPVGTVLTDEISLLRRTERGWRAYGTPFWGEFRAGGHNASYPVAGIYSLAQAAENRLEASQPKDLLRAMLPCVLFFSSDTGANRALLDVLTSFSQTVAGFRLHFKKEASFWEVVAR